VFLKTYGCYAFYDKKQVKIVKIKMQIYTYLYMRFHPNNVNYKERERIKKRNHAEKIGSSFGEIILAGVPCAK
jgi:hypothetical protein